MRSPLSHRPSLANLTRWSVNVLGLVVASSVVHCSSEYKPKAPASAAFTSTSSNAAGTSSTLAEAKSNDSGTAPALPAGGSSQSSTTPDPVAEAPKPAANTAGTQIQVAAVAVAPAPSGPAYSLVGVGASRCIDVTAEGLTTDGTVAVLQDCTLGSPQQGFTQTALGQLRLIGSKRCLDTAGATTAASASLVTATCADIPSQKWDVAAKAGLAGAVALKGTSLCIDVANAKIDNGSPIHTSPCKAADNQAWRLGGA